MSSLRELNMTEVTTKRSKAGWTTVAFGDVVRQVKDKVDPDESGLDRYVAGEHMDTDDLRIRRWGEIGDGYLGPAFHMRFKPGHVLYGSRRTYLRKVAVADFEGITANTTYVLEPKEPNVLLPEMLPFIMQTEAFNQHSVRESKGSVNPYVNFSDLAWYEFALPPIDEQRRLTTALRCIEAVSESITQVRLSLELLETSCVDAWLASLHRKGVTPVALADVLLSRIEYGVNAPAVEHAAALPRFIRITDIDDQGRLREDALASVAAEVDESCFVRPGDLLIARTGNTIGKTYLVDGSEGRAVYAGYLLRARPDPSKVIPKYLMALTRSSKFRKWVSVKMRVGTQPNINAKEYAAFPILLPNGLSRQAELCDRMAEIVCRRASCNSQGASARRMKSLLLQGATWGAQS
jgi:type I restriction enzyme S subunit